MRIPRITGDGKTNYYHVMSRIVDGHWIMGDQEKEKLLQLMVDHAAYSGIEILTYTIMSNHFHILLGIPEPEALDDADVLERLAHIYDERRMQELKQQLDWFRSCGCDHAVEGVIKRYHVRMWNLSDLVKSVKQRFTQWYNVRSNRRGTLWEGRFTSVLVEGSENALWTMAAYIDLNCVRAGIVDDPMDYRFCGYGAALGGVTTARQGLMSLVQVQGLHATPSWEEAQETYRKHLFVAGLKKDERRGYDQQQVREILEQGGKLNKAVLLACRIRYFSAGVLLGSQEFVNRVFAKYRDCFGRNRTTGARRMKGGDWDDLCTMRDLRKAPIMLSAQPQPISA